MRSSAVTVGTTPTLIAKGGTRAVPKSVAIQVPGNAANPIFVGGDDVSGTNGISVPAGSIFTLELIDDAIYVVAIADTDIRVLVRNG